MEKGVPNRLKDSAWLSPTCRLSSAFVWFAYLTVDTQKPPASGLIVPLKAKVFFSTITCQSKWGVLWKTDAPFGTLYLWIFFSLNEVTDRFKPILARFLLVEVRIQRRFSPTFCTIFCMLLSHNSVKNVKCLLDNSFGFVTVYICRMWMYFLHVFCL